MCWLEPLLLRAEGINAGELRRTPSVVGAFDTHRELFALAFLAAGERDHYLGRERLRARGAYRHQRLVVLGLLTRHGAEIRRGLAEHLFELVDETLGERMVHVFAGGAREFFEQFALAGGQATRGFNCDPHKLVAAPIAMQVREALALEPEDLTRLRAGRNLELDLAVECRHFYLASERGLREADRHFDHNVIVLADEQSMLFDMDDDVEVAGRSAAETGFTFSTQLEA